MERGKNMVELLKFVYVMILFLFLFFVTTEACGGKTHYSEIIECKNDADCPIGYKCIDEMCKYG
ncbi:putative Late nodulin [Medicago truncatula]|uniref:Nodule Cysteine-Rich (NCR) secreted peptide n=1 Tax=Medicago truncatula TaxID=3880 RepID=G7JLV0_MEDTR|nr:Nodule Cysteine-Rich (NCR) secreted peptide [Medicago truncatula]RHN58752.1 putative Late nodulin [Medicago truncatula]